MRSVYRTLHFSLIIGIGFLPATFAKEQNVMVRYSVKCDSRESETFPGVVGEAKIGKRKVRFELFKYLKQVEFAVPGKTDVALKDIHFKFFASSGCKLEEYQAEVSSDVLALAEDGVMADVARKHSPYVIMRSDQRTDRYKDVPLALTYSVSKTGEHTKIRYTLFFSNESVNGPFDTTKSQSLSWYGRRTDIEWVYEVELDENLQVVNRWYQGSLFLGIGHKTLEFRGKFLAGTSHPVLYDIAKHNVFSDFPYPKQMGVSLIGHHLVPREEIRTPDAREWWMWRNPWSFDVSDRELSRNGELDHASNDYLYVLLEGALNGSKVGLEVSLGGETYSTENDVKKLGEDLWGTQTFSAIQIDEAKMNVGAISAVRLNSDRGTEKLSTPRLFRLFKDEVMGFVVREVSISPGEVLGSR